MKIQNIPLLMLMFLKCLHASSINTEELFAKASPYIFLIQIRDNENSESFGTGFSINGGYIVTNHHVIKNAKCGILKNKSDTTFPIMKVVADDEYRDIAILETVSNNISSLTLGNSDDAHVGSGIAVIGNPEGFENTISEGIISGIRNLDDYNNVFQISAPISKGSSGSPIFNSNNEVIGMVSSYFKNGQLINFAIPSNQITDLIKRYQTLKTPTKKLSLPDEYLNNIRQEAKAGDPKSQYFLGLIYSRSKDYNAAVQWFELAAKKSYYPAEEMLGYFSKKGLGTSEDHSKANYWFNRSIEHGNNELKKKLYSN
jgi:S1-C subfamily serine protease